LLLLEGELGIVVDPVREGLELTAAATLGLSDSTPPLIVLP